MNQELKQRLNAVIAAGCKLVDEKTASIAPELFDGLKESGKLVKAGTRINWNGKLKKSAVDLWDTVENNPDNAPSLWEDILYKNGYRIIPDIITVTAAFSKDECGWWEDVLYRSREDNNVHTPSGCPGNWEAVR